MSQYILCTDFVVCAMYTAIRRLCIILSLSTQVFSSNLDNNQTDSKEMMHTNQGLESIQDTLCTSYSEHCINPERMKNLLDPSKRTSSVGYLPKRQNIRIPNVSELPITLKDGTEINGRDARKFLNNLFKTCRKSIQNPRIVRPIITNRIVI